MFQVLLKVLIKAQPTQWVKSNNFWFPCLTSGTFFTRGRRFIIKMNAMTDNLLVQI